MLEILEIVVELVAITVFGVGFWPWCCCGGTTCSYCTNITAPAEWQVEISGVANDHCTNCDRWNGTYVLTIATPIGLECLWQVFVSPKPDRRSGGSCVAGLSPSIEIDIRGPSISANYFIWVRLMETGGTYKSFFKDYGGSAPDCVNLSAVDIPYDSEVGDPACDASGGTCTLTAL